MALLNKITTTRDEHEACEWWNRETTFFAGTSSNVSWNSSRMVCMGISMYQRHRDGHIPHDGHSTQVSLSGVNFSFVLLHYYMF